MKKAVLKRDIDRLLPTEIDEEKLIPSLEMREILAKKGRAFSARERATLILNADLTWDEMNRYMEILASETTDEYVKSEMEKAVRLNELKLESILTFSEDEIFELYLKEEDSTEDFGVFENPQTAFAYGRKSGLPFHISKLPIIRGERAEEDLGEEKLYDGEHSGDGCCIASISFDTEGRITYLDTDEVTEEMMQYEPDGNDYVMW